MRLAVYIVAALLLVNCGKETIENPDCEKLISGLIEKDELAVKTEIEKLTADLNPLINAEDQYGHSKNLNTLIERLTNQCSTITSELICYACIYTYPPISEIKVEFYQGNVQHIYVLDIFTAKDDIPRYAGLHSQISNKN